MKKIVIILVTLLSFLSNAQDKVINLTISQPNAALSVSGGATPATGFGLSNGSVNISVSEGTGPYTYSWSQTDNPGFSANTQNLTNLFAGEYNVVVTDANNCTTSASYTVNEPDPLTVNITNPIGFEIDCFGNNNGQLLATASGGTPNYSFSWEKFISGSFQNLADIGPTLSSQTAGLYRVTVTDFNSITAQDTFTLNEPTQLTVNFTQTDVLCFGDNTGSIDLTITGGTGPYTVDWLDIPNDGNPEPVDRINIIAGDYTYSVSDANGCTVNNYSAGSEITITQPTELIITVPVNGIQPPTANGASDGSISINVTGGSESYQYSWSNGDTFPNISGLAEGDYTITVTDIPNNCTVSETYTLIAPPPLSVSINTTQIIPCNGGAGTLQATATGGVPNPGPSYNYEWFDISSGSPVSIGITTASASNLTVGDYRVIATDNNGNTTSADQSLTEPTTLVLSTPSSSNILCFGGNDGSASITASGGTLGYTYAWTKTGDIGYSASTASINTLTAGEYNLTVTDANLCTASTSVTITQPASAVSITLANQTNVLINGQSTGAIDINISGGTPSYSYLWTKTGDVGFSETTQDLINISAGEYTVIVSDSNSASSSNSGCIATQTFTITQPTALNVSASISSPLNCFGDTNGELIASVSGGVAPFSISWYEIIATVPDDLGISTNTISGLFPGEYQVQVTDANGAMADDNIILTEPLELIASIASTTNVNCFGGATGSIDIEVSGGTGNYTYTWSDANGPIANTTQDLINLVIGSYSVSIQDDNGCSTSLTSIVITEPNATLSIASNPIITDASGNGLTNGSIEVTVAGGTTPYTYVWIDSLNNTLPSTTNVLNNIGAGSYFLTVTDANTCSLGPIEYIVNEPAPIIVSISNPVNNIACFGETGTLTATVSGGIAPYSYNWYNVLDNTTTLSNTNTLTTVAGEYTLVITDANGIVNSQNVILNQPTALVVTPTQTNVLCNAEATGSIDLTITGGVGPYTYNWSNTATTQNISGLIAGTYSVTVRDANLCEEIISVTITQTTTAISIVPSPIITNTTGFGLTDGSIEVTVTGGTTPYSYLWVDATNTTLPSTTNILNNIGAGSYFLTVTDANNCSLDPIEYIVNEPAPIIVSISNPPNNIACFGDTGILTATVSGGIAPYSYNWYNVLDNTTTLSNTNTLTTIAGEYTLVVTDDNGIVNNQTVMLNEPNELLIDPNFIINNVSCYNGTDGSIEINVTGGTGTYTYGWSNSGSSTNIQNGLSSGVYSVIVTDGSGCSTSSGPITIAQPEEFSISGALLIRPTNTNTSDGSIAINITGGIAPFDYEWFEFGNSILLTANEIATSNTINSLNEGLYTIVITDSTGCTITTEYNLANPGELLASAYLMTEISCFGADNGVLNVDAIGGAGGNNYTWYNAIDDSQIGGNTQTLNNVAPGSYYVVVSNADGLQEQSSVIVVTQPDAITASLSQNNPTCFANNDGNITITAIGGSGVYEYNYQVNGGGYSASWFTFDNSNSSIITSLVAGNYDIRVRDAIGCFYEVSGTIGTLSTTLTQPDDLLINNAIINNPTGFGLTNGSIDVTVSGGTSPYTYAWSDINGSLPETTNILSNLPVGNYTVTITDVNNCTVQQTYTLTQPQDLLVTVQNVNINLCNGDNSASLNAIGTGGVLPYSYQWFEDGNTTVIGTSQLLENLSAGNYYAVITDANSNTVLSNTTTVTQPDTLTISLLSDFILCGDGNDWEVTPTITGGTEPYTYSWSNNESTTSISNVIAGTYTLTVTDANGCLQTETVSFVAPPPITISETITNPTCFQSADGSIETIINGGTLPYTYSWDNGENTENISNLTSGTYQLTITDFKGCELIRTFTLTDPDELILDLAENVTLCVDQTHIIDAEIPDGVSYQWTSNNGFSSTDQIVELSQAGVYTVTAVNSLGCIATHEVTITISSQIISAEFLLSTQVFVDEVFYIIDDSDPIPDDIIWILPTEAELISENNTFAEVRFDTAGEYEITIITIIGDCSKSQTKTVLVTEQEEFFEEESNGLGPIITEFTIFPNPSDGNFNVNIELRETLPISLKIFGLVNNSMIDYRTFEGESSYNSGYTLNVPSGIYFIVLETAFATQLQKIVIE